jgi:hypothetical protein
MHVQAERPAVDLGCADIHELAQGLFQSGSVHIGLQSGHCLAGIRLDMFGIDAGLRGLSPRLVLRIGRVVTASRACQTKLAGRDRTHINRDYPDDRQTRSSQLVCHRREIRAGRLVIESCRHQIHLVDETQAVLQSPAEQLAVARREQKPAAGKA